MKMMTPPTTPPRQTRPRARLPILLFALLMLLISALACNLSSAPPPTVPPRQPSPTPEATLGISTQAPIALPSGVQAQAPTDPGVEALLRQVSTDNLMAHTAAMFNVETRYVNSTQRSDTTGIGAARRYIYDTFSSYAPLAAGRLTVWEHPFTLTWEDQETLQHNVVCTLQGTENGAGVIIVGGHYDSVAYDVDSSVYAPGADDNGTGIAALLEMARIMAQTPHRATIIFVAFSAEEVGRFGSIRFIDEYIKQYDIDVRAVITVDTIGNITGANNEINDRQIRLFSDDNNNSPSRQLSRSLHLVAGTYVPDMQIIVQPGADREGRWGDHMSFTAAGYPAIRLIEAVQHPARQNNSLDTIEHVSPAYLTKSTQITLATLAVLADGLQPPDNITLRPNPNDSASHTLVWAPVEGAVGYVIALREPGAITYSQVLTVNATNSLTWSGFDPARFEALAISAVDRAGRWGPFSTEYMIEAP